MTKVQINYENFRREDEKNHTSFIEKMKNPEERTAFEKKLLQAGAWSPGEIINRDLNCSI